MTAAHIMEAAQANARRRLEAAQAVVIRDIDRMTVGPNADPAITPAWRNLTLARRDALVGTEVLHAFSMQADDRYDDVIPRAIRAVIRYLVHLERSAHR